MKTHSKITEIGALQKFISLCEMFEEPNNQHLMKSKGTCGESARKSHFALQTSKPMLDLIKEHEYKCDKNSRIDVET